MNKAELVSMMAEKSGLTKKDSEASLNAFVDAVTEELKYGGKVQLIGFGTFEVHDRKALTVHYPRTVNQIKIPASKSPVFKAGKALKDLVNNK